jgi:hypothetical protein
MSPQIPSPLSAVSLLNIFREYFYPARRRIAFIVVHGSLVTLAVQNSALTIIMHYSRVSTPPSRTYSAATAVLMNEILKGTISLIIAFWRLDTAQTPYEHPHARTYPQRFATRLRKLSREVFSQDCWKLSIPAILYGQSSPCLTLSRPHDQSSPPQSSKIICSMSLRPI